jgi:hypothetical protein
MKPVLGLILGAFCVNASAEWLEYANTPRETNYYDPKSIRRGKETATVWQLVNLKQKARTSDGEFVSSMKVKLEFRCRDESVRIQIVILHPEQDAGGYAVGMDNRPPTEWFPVAPNTVYSALLAKTCKG